MSLKKEYFLHLLKKYNDGSCSYDEKVIIESYFDKCQDHNILLNDSEVFIKKKIYKGIKKEISRKRLRTSLLLPRNILKYTASLLFLLSLGYFINENQELKTHIVYTKLGEKKEVSLPDGTLVFLNSGSQLSYRNNYNQTERNVKLQGEAYFDVHRDINKPFTVETNEFTTKVLGTSFNIKTPDKNNKATIVSVTSGKVNVYNLKHRIDEKLIKNDQLLYDHSRQQLEVNHQHDSKLDAAWKENIIALNGNNLEATAHVLEKWFDINIIISDPALKEIKVNGKYINPSLEEVLESLKFSTGITYSFSDEKTIYLKKDTMNKIRSE
ncbi:FecR family protein [Zhouia amylolytica]|uniref:FecR family protein n=1 Tax=Zhouia amylolytica TaxID=376730 RepID=A0A1I6TF22_9FLAO|nr:FecR domain-containing protein [Zhouia amylolytica]MCQ0112174.1 FecR domain-containing protein [Zhouia amylolytica]SFS87794.1 FecR family protein [Zhouia amylolytica]